MVDENDDMSIDPATEKNKKKIDSLQTETHDDRSISSVPPAYMIPYYMRFFVCFFFFWVLGKEYTDVIIAIRHIRHFFLNISMYMPM